MFINKYGKNYDFYIRLIHLYKGYWTTDDPAILMVESSSFKGNKIIHDIAANSDKTGWYINDNKLLKQYLPLRGSVNRSQWIWEGNCVAHMLACLHPTWTTNNKEILELKNYEDDTVYDMLKRENKI